MKITIESNEPVAIMPAGSYQEHPNISMVVPQTNRSSNLEWLVQDLIEEVLKGRGVVELPNEGVQLHLKNKKFIVKKEEPGAHYPYKYVYQ